jgi:hypothetical protein
MRFDSNRKKYHTTNYKYDEFNRCIEISVFPTVGIDTDVYLSYEYSAEFYTQIIKDPMHYEYYYFKIPL